MTDNALNTPAPRMPCRLLGQAFNHGFLREIGEMGLELTKERRNELLRAVEDMQRVAIAHNMTVTEVVVATVRLLDLALHQLLEHHEQERANGEVAH